MVDLLYLPNTKGSKNMTRIWSFIQGGLADSGIVYVPVGSVTATDRNVISLTTARGSDNYRMTLYRGTRVTATNIDNNSMATLQCRHSTYDSPAR